MTELMMCRGPERQPGAGRPDLVNAAILPSAQPPGAGPVACARDLEGLSSAAPAGGGRPGARSPCSTGNG